MGLDSVEIVMAIEDEFGITIPDEQAQDCHTVGELIEIVWSIGPSDDRSYREVKNRIRSMVAEQMGLRLRDVRPESTWRELGVD